jgi:hypothetical protein
MERVMHEIAILIIWFSSIIAGMMLTMLLPHIFPEASGNGERQDELVPMSSEEELRERSTSEVPVGKAA